MLSTERIKKMIRLSDYENGLGSTDLSRVHYDKADYIRLQALHTAGAVLTSYVLVVVLVAMYYLDDLLYQTISVSWGIVLPFALTAAVGILVFAVVVSCVRASAAYDESKLRSEEYYATLQELMQLYEKEEQGQEEEV